MGENAQATNAGSLVENGQNVSQDYDPRGGNMRIRTPEQQSRIKDENTLVFLVIDGRQPGYSKALPETACRCADRCRCYRSGFTG